MSRRPVGEPAESVGRSSSEVYIRASLWISRIKATSSPRQRAVKAAGKDTAGRAGVRGRARTMRAEASLKFPPLPPISMGLRRLASGWLSLGFLKYGQSSVSWSLSHFSHRPAGWRGGPGELVSRQGGRRVGRIWRGRRKGGRRGFCACA